MPPYRYDARYRKVPPVALPDIGDEFMGGFYAGIIDTTQDNIDANDAYQAGARYALIMAPKALQTINMFRTNSDPIPYLTLWDGLSAQRDLLPDATLLLHTHASGLTPPEDDASEWYVPALDELKLLMTNFKPTTDDNETGAGSTTWPAIVPAKGENNSSDPQYPAQTAGSPAQTSLAAFQSGEPEALSLGSGTQFHISTTPNDDNRFITWIRANTLNEFNFSFTTDGRVMRPVRRLVL